MATELQLVDDGIVSALRSDFDSKHDKVSPGSYLNMELLKSLFEGGETEYRMGPGTNPYKRRWAEGAVDLRKANINARSLTGRAVHMYSERLRPVLASARSRLQRLRRRTR